MKLLRTASAIAVLVLSTGCGDDARTAAPSSTVTTSTPPNTSPTSADSSTTTEPSSTSTTRPTSTASSTSTAPPTTMAPPTTPPPTTPPPPDPGLLERGDSGEAVSAVQQRLAGLHYWIGPVDGVYGQLTEQAVYAFQKVNGLAVDGAVGPATRRALDEPVAYPPDTSDGDIMEIDKGRQVLVHVVDGRVDLIWNTSTGTENPYTSDGAQHVADTPPGRHEIFRQVDGIRHAPLGDLYRPKYFHRDGIAIHGYSNVPPVPDSHGCVRVTRPAMDHIWTTGMAPMGSVVVVHGTTPATTSEGSGPATG